MPEPSKYQGGEFFRYAETMRTLPQRLLDLQRHVTNAQQDLQHILQELHDLHNTKTVFEAMMKDALALSPEVRAAATADELPEEEIAARLKEVREKGGLELHQFIQDLRQEVEHVDQTDGAPAA